MISFNQEPIFNYLSAILSISISNLDAILLGLCSLPVVSHFHLIGDFKVQYKGHLRLAWCNLHFSPFLIFISRDTLIFSQQKNLIVQVIHFYALESSMRGLNTRDYFGRKNFTTSHFTDINIRKCNNYQSTYRLSIILLY